MYRVRLHVLGSVSPTGTTTCTISSTTRMPIYPFTCHSLQPVGLSLLPSLGFVFFPHLFDLARQAPTGTTCTGKSEMNIGGLNQCSAGIHQAMLLGYAHSKQQVDCVDIEEVSPAAIGQRAAVRIVWSPFQPVYSVVYEGVTAMIMSYFCEKNLFAMNPLLMYNW